MDNRPRTLVIINNTAARARRAWPPVRDTLTKNSIRFDAHETAHAGDAMTTTRAALRAGYETIAVVGGDGTLSEAASGFFDWNEKTGSSDFNERATGSDEKTEDVANEGKALGLPAPVNTQATLAILPAGTGDDFARGLAKRRESAVWWMDKLVAHCRRVDQRDLDRQEFNQQGLNRRTTRAIDVIAASTNDGAERFICLNVATIGLGAEVASRVAAQRRLMQKLSGEARFVAAACGALAAWRERRVRVVVDDDEAIECPSNLLAVANNIYAGGGMMFAPDARTDDGLLDVLVACGITRATILRELPRIRTGRHLSNPKVKLITGARARISTISTDDPLPVEADGNVRGHTPAEFRIMPGALRIVR